MRKPKRGLKFLMHRPVLAPLCSVFLFCLLTLASGCSETRTGPGPAQTPPQPYRGATGQIPFPQESPRAFIGKLTPAGQGLASWRDLEPALTNSINYVNTKKTNESAVNRPGLSVTWGRLAATLERLRGLLPRLDAEPGLLMQNFTWARVDESIMFTGYYEPTIPASRTPKPGLIPIYSTPPDMAKQKKRGKSYHDRAAIDKRGALAGKGLEMAWMDPVEAFFLQVQGSGRLRFDDGTEAYVNYASQNGHKYVSIGRIMKEQGLLEEGNVNMPAIKNWLRDNPARRDEMLLCNPSYVFFRWGTKPKGAMGFFVQPGISLAVSRSYIPLGAVVAYGVNLPDPQKGGLPVRAIGLAQDTGGAIKGRRIDIFCGDGPRAEYIAGHLDVQGEAWVLLAK